MTNSYFGQLLIDLQNYLKTEVTELRWIDQDLGQLETFEYRPSVSFPCLLVDFGTAQYNELSQLAQQGDIRVQLRLGFAPFSPSDVLAPTDVREKSLVYYALEQKIFEKLHGWETAYTTPFSRISAVTEQRDDTLRVRVITFTTSYEDDSAIKQYVSIQVPISIETETF